MDSKAFYQLTHIMVHPMNDPAQRLFNCQPNGNPPIWSGFVSLMIGGCRDDDGTTEGGQTYQTAEFFTVYGIDPDGMADAITDVPTVSLIHALSVANELATLSGLPLTVCRSLFS
jgi:hypothetical protein